MHVGYSSVPLVKGGRWKPEADRFREWLTGDVRWAVVSRMNPGGYILPHRDKGPWRTRTQYPLHPAGWYWDEAQGVVAMTEPREYLVRHDVAHAVWNDTDRDRIHLVIDRGDPAGDGPFELHPGACPALEEWRTRHG